jgi:hypothetical protein
VLFLANRCVCHPRDGGIEHLVDYEEMTSAINTVLFWVKSSGFPAISEIDPSLFEQLP